MTCTMPLPPEVDALDRIARHAETPLPGGGRMVWRSWGTGPALVLVHGGAGSWLHWLRVIGPLTGQGWRVIAPDLPGYGTSDALPEGYTIDTIAQAVHAGLTAVAGEGPVRMVGFSFGGVVAGHVAETLGAQLRHLVLVGSGGLGGLRPPMAPLVKWRALPEAERPAAHRRNLEILMFADPARITPEDVAIQAWNAEHARGTSRPISRADTMPRVLQGLRARLDGIWGEKDAVAIGLLEHREDLLRSIDPGARLIRVPGAGHWVQQESPDFTAILTGILCRSQ